MVELNPGQIWKTDKGELREVVSISTDGGRPAITYKGAGGVHATCSIDQFYEWVHGWHRPGARASLAVRP